MARKDTVVGLDIGRYSVKAVWAGIRDGRPTVLRAETLPLPTNKADSANIIAPWIKNMDLAKHPCVVGLSGEKAMFQPILLTPNDPRTIEQTAAIEVLKYNEMASETMIYGFSPIAINEGERRLLLSMSREAVVNETLAFARSLGLDVADLVPTPVALFNSLEASSEPHVPPFLYINIGAFSTEMVIGAKSGLMFARSFPSGGQTFTDSLMESNPQLSTSQAENQKLMGSSPSQTSAPLTPALTQVADRWLTELQACISVFQSLYPARKAQPVRAILAGGGSKLRGLREHIASQLGIETIHANVLPGNVKMDNATDLVVAAGLAAGGFHTSPVSISLLPNAARREIALKRQRPFWIASGIAAALIVAASLAGGTIEYLRMEKHLGIQQASLSRRQQLVDEIESSKARNDQICRMSYPVKTLLRGAPIIRRIITLVGEAKSPDDSIGMICDVDSYLSRSFATAPEQKTVRRDRRRTAQAPGVEEKTDTGFQRVIIEGYTRTPDLSTVKALITKLKASGLVASADLLNDDELASGQRTENSALGQRFVIDVKIVEP
jgi:Tfp pilus assembly PilM family ATPase